MTAAIVLAAGSGRRMNGPIAKQYMELAGHPVLYYALKAFDESAVDCIVLVVSQEVYDLAMTGGVPVPGSEDIKKKFILAVGGPTRGDSVLNGLKALGAADYVLVHDGARPFVTPQLIAQMMCDVQRCGACVAAVPVKDTVKHTADGKKADYTLTRSELMAMQTPQAFAYAKLLSAYSLAKEDGGMETITDDAMAVEVYLKEDVYFSEGSYRNIKITTPEDLLIAETFLKMGLF